MHVIISSIIQEEFSDFLISMDEVTFVSKAVPVFKELDTLLRCGICYEYMTTAMITACSHNYCSLCIRKSLLYKAQCPSCFEEAYDNQLRNNRLVDSLIDIFVRLSSEIKNLLLEFDIPAKKLSTEIHVHTKSKFESEVQKNSLVREISTGAFYSNKSPDNVRSRNERVIDNHKPSTSLASIVKKEVDVMEMQEGSSDELPMDGPSKHQVELGTNSKAEPLIPSMFTPKKKTFKPIMTTPANLVPCPVCSVEIPEHNINLHLDACLKMQEMAQERSPKKAQKRKPMPKLVYALLQDRDLKKKLKELGLSDKGDRKTLISRHQRYTLLYNSECDSVNPRSSAEIIQQIEREEKEEKRANTAGISNLLKVDRKADPKVIEQAKQQYLQQNKSSFESLIQAIRSREAAKKPVKRNLITSDDEDDNVESKPKPSFTNERAVLSKNCISDDEEDEVDIVSTVPVSVESESSKNHIDNNDDDDSTDIEEDFAINKQPANDNIPSSVQLSDHNIPNNEALNETETVNTIEIMDDTTFDMDYEIHSDDAHSPVLGKNTMLNSSRQDTKHRGSPVVTPDMFGSKSESNDSISLLSQMSPGSVPTGETGRIGDIKPPSLEPLDSEIELAMRRVDSQLEDPDFIPNLDEISQDFEIKRPATRGKRKARKPQTPISSPVERRTLRKRVKL